MALAKDTSKAFVEEIQQLIASGQDDIFEDGVETEFSRKLIFLVQEYGSSFVESLTAFISTERITDEFMAEILRWIGKIEHPVSFHSRRQMLESALKSTSSRIRDGAVLGFASLDDPASIPALKQAIQYEVVSELRQDMQQVLEQLQNTLTGV